MTDLSTMACFRSVRPGAAAPSPRGAAGKRLAPLLGVAVLLTGCVTPPPLGDTPPAPMPTTVAPVATPDSPEVTARPPLTLEAAIQRALDCNSEIAALRAALEIAEQRKRAATDITDPELSLAWSEQTTDGLRNRRGTEVTDSSESDVQTSTRTQTTTESTVESGGGPVSTSTGTGTTTDRRVTSGRSTQTQSTTTTGYGTEDTDGYRVGLRLFVPNLWQMMPRLSARRAEIEAAKADLRAAEWRVTCDVRRLFNELAYLTGNVAYATELARLNGEIMETAQARVKQGAALATDVMTAMRRDLQAQDELDVLRQRHATARRDLGLLLNLSLDSTALDLPELTPPALPTQDLSNASLERFALLRRPDIAALHWRTAAAQAAYREARNIRLPWIKEINASYRASQGDSRGTDTSSGSSHESGTSSSSSAGEGQRIRTETQADGTVRESSETSSEQEDSVSRNVHDEASDGTTWIHDESESEEWLVGVAIDIPIFSWVKNHAHDVLRAEHALAEVLETDGQRLVRREIGDALDEWRESWRQQTRYDRVVEPLIAKMQQTVASLESTPGTMPDQVAAAKAQVIESLRLRLGARHRSRQAIVILERALGAPLAEAVAPDAPRSGR